MITQPVLRDCMLAIWVVYNEIIVSIKTRNFALWLLCHLNRAIPHSMVTKLDVRSACAASLKLIWDCLPSGWLWCVDQNTNFCTLAAMPPEQRITRCSSQHGDEGGCSLSLCCKFEINWRLFAIWLVEIKFTPIKHYEFVGPA